MFRNVVLECIERVKKKALAEEEKRVQLRVSEKKNNKKGCTIYRQWNEGYQTGLPRVLSMSLSW